MNAATVLVSARRDARSLVSFPGVIPTDLFSAYAAQDLVVAEEAERIVGWKVGTIGADFRAQFQSDRFVGPILERDLHIVRGAEILTVPLPVAGFAAVEAELAFKLGEINDPRRDQDIDSAIIEVRLAVEVLGSPIADILALGPGAIIGDHGLNAGLVLGPVIEDWRSWPACSILATVDVNGRRVGAGSGGSIAGGPAAALAFLVRTLSDRGRRLEPGSWISTGALTGLHPIQDGSSVRVDFGELGAFGIHFAAPTAHGKTPG